MRSTEPGNRRSKRLQENRENMKKKNCTNEEAEERKKRLQ